MLYLTYYIQHYNLCYLTFVLFDLYYDLSTLEEITSIKDASYIDGKIEFKYLNDRGFITVLSSGNIYPILKYYQDLLGITYIFGSMPNMYKDTIESISESTFKGNNFKYESCLKILNKYKDRVVYGIGDSAVDIDMLSLADVSFAIDPKGKLEEHVDYVIKDMREIIEYIANE